MSILDIRPVAANAELTVAQQFALEEPCNPKVSGVARYTIQNPGAVVRAFRPSVEGCKEVGFVIGLATGMVVTLNYAAGPLTGQNCLEPLTTLSGAAETGALWGACLISMKRIGQGVIHINSEYRGWVHAEVTRLTHQAFIEIIDNDPVLGDHPIRAQFRKDPVLAPELVPDAETRTTLIQRFEKLTEHVRTFKEHAYQKSLLDSLSGDVQLVMRLSICEGFVDSNDFETLADRATRSSLGFLPRDLLKSWIDTNLVTLMKAEGGAAKPPAKRDVPIPRPSDNGHVVVAHEAPENPAPLQQNGGMVHWVKWLFGCAQTPC